MTDSKPSPASYSAGWNQPGYMPDTPPSAYSTWEGARDSLVWELERADFIGDGETLAVIAAWEAECKAAIETLQAAPVGQDVTTAPVSGYVFYVMAGDEAPDDPGDLESVVDTMTESERAGWREVGAAMEAAAPAIQPARYLAATADGHLGREIEGEECDGFTGFFAGAVNQGLSDFDSGWMRAQCVAFAQGVLARTQATPKSDCPYAQFSAAWEAWSDGFNARDRNAL